MIDILLTAPAFAVFECARDWQREWQYHERIKRTYFKPGSYTTIQAPSPDAAARPPIQEVSTAVWVTPDGFARLEEILKLGDIRVTTIVTPEEEISAQLSPSQSMHGRPRHPDPLSREFDDIFGRPYPNEALALLNPYLMMRDYTCVPGSAHHSSHVGHRVTISRYTHNPDFPLNASDDAERLGSMDIAAWLADSKPLLLGWDALDGDTPFQQTRITQLELNTSFTGLDLFSAESARQTLRPGVLD